jgi:hypothetical protein
MTDNHKHPPGREPPDLPPKPEPEPDTKARAFRGVRRGRSARLTTSECGCG